MPTNSSFVLSQYDYVIFGITLGFSMSIGIYFGCFGSRQSTIKDYLLGGKKMKMIPIAISVAVSHFSGTALVAFPAEVFRYGAGMWWILVCYTIMGFLGIYIYLPVFFKLQCTSIYEYLERRFDKRTRILACVFYIIGEILVFPIHMYSAALTFGTASGFNVPLTGFILFVICVLYTALGGLKSVVWTDLFQFTVIMSSLITVYVMGLNSAGGFLSVWKTAINGERLDIFNFGSDLTTRDGFWGYFFGTTTAVIASTIVHQTGIQKFLALPKYKDCISSMIYLVISLCIVYSFCILIGLLCYAKYKDCDPLSGHIIDKHDQLVPLYVADVAGLVPGISGLLIAGICSASLSSISSDLNALVTVIYKEFMSLFLKRQPTEISSSNVLKLTTLVLGLLCASLIFVVDKVGDIFVISATVQSVTKGPLLGLFTLGFIFPRANKNGAFYGTILAGILLLCLIVPSKLYHLQGLIKYPTKPLSTAGCNILNHTSNWINGSFTNINMSKPIENSWQPPSIFRMSFYFYPFFGMALTVIFGVLISYLVKSQKVVDENLLSPINLSCLSRKSRRKDKVEYSQVAQDLDKTNVPNK